MRLEREREEGKTSVEEERMKWKWRWRWASETRDTALLHTQIETETPQACKANMEEDT